MEADLLNYCTLILLFKFDVRYLSMSYANAHVVDDMIGMIYMCISNLNARLITLLLVSGNSVIWKWYGNMRKKDHAHCFTGMTKLRCRKGNSS